MRLVCFSFSLFLFLLLGSGIHIQCHSAPKCLYPLVTFYVVFLLVIVKHYCGSFTAWRLCANNLCVCKRILVFIRLNTSLLYTVLTYCNQTQIQESSRTQRNVIKSPLNPPHWHASMECCNAQICLLHVCSLVHRILLLSLRTHRQNRKYNRSREFILSSSSHVLCDYFLHRAARTHCLSTDTKRHGFVVHILCDDTGNELWRFSRFKQ